MEKIRPVILKNVNFWNQHDSYDVQFFLVFSCCWVSHGKKDSQELIKNNLLEVDKCRMTPGWQKRLQLKVFKSLFCLDCLTFSVNKESDVRNLNQKSIFRLTSKVPKFLIEIPLLYYVPKWLTKELTTKKVQLEKRSFSAKSRTPRETTSTNFWNVWETSQKRRHCIESSEMPKHKTKMKKKR